MATFVLVHGGWAGAVVWRQLAPRLRKAGHEVYAPTLTGIGARKHLLSHEINLDTHIQDVIGVIDDADLSDIVLVGHSYGGMVITGVADRVPEKVVSLVYLDAFVPENGGRIKHLNRTKRFRIAWQPERKQFASRRGGHVTRPHRLARRR